MAITDWIEDFQGWRIYDDNGEFVAREMADPPHVLTAQTLEKMRERIGDANGLLASAKIDSGSLNENPEPEHGRWWGAQFCPHPGQPCIDGCYFCGKPVGSITGDHDHTKVSKRGEPDAYSCCCPNC